MRRFTCLVAWLVLAAGCGDDEPGGNNTTADAGVRDAQVDAEPVDPLDYLDRSLQEQVAAVESGTVDCQDLAQGYVDRIAARDDGAEGINSFISVVDDPVGLGAQLNSQRGSGLLLLCGVIAVKDNIDQAGLPTTAGSLALENNVTDEDAPLVAKLRAQGALLIGKTNLSEWANMRGYSSSSGWSSLGGQTKNGADPDYNPCGSSSGSAAAVAAGIVPAAIGTETDGSITCPAAINGVVGLKPTVGLVSRTNVIPISHTQDTAGPITLTVADAARLLSVMAGPDPLDPATSAIPGDLDLDFEAQLDGVDLSELRLGMVTTMTGYSSGTDDVFFAEIQRFQDAGAIVLPVQLPTGVQYGADEMTVLLHEYKVGLNDYLANHPQPGQPGTLAELITFNDDHAAEIMPYFGQELLVLAEATTGLSATEYLNAKQNAAQVAGTDGILAVLQANDLDALVAPTTGPAWVTNYVTGDTFSGSASGPAAVAGYPHITVPMGEVNGLPVGLSIFAGPWQDALVLALAYAYEQLPR